MLDDTIIALSTPLGYGGLGIIRLSGSRALEISRTLFQPRKLKRIPARRMVLGTLVNPETKRAFEEAFLTFFPRPHTYTREDMVEISCHGSPVIMEEIVRLGIGLGARHADPGEFTLRAYMNGRIDILQAEAVADLIHATSLDQARISFNQLEGNLSKKIKLLRRQIIRLASQIEASIEFPDESLGISPQGIGKYLNTVKSSVSKLISSYELGKILLKGSTLAITGKTNTGKSTLFNSLLEKPRAIVSELPGTTRDYLKEKIKIRDAVINLIDMAGLNTPSDPIENEGIKRSRRMTSSADGILLLLDSSRRETADDIALIQQFSSKPMLILFNKSDLEQEMDIERIKREFPSIPFLKISALKKTGLTRLTESIYENFVPRHQNNGDVILHLHQKLILEQIAGHIDAALHLQEKGYSEDLFVEEIRQALPLIGRLTGEIHAEDIINEIFGRFCVGK